MNTLLHAWRAARHHAERSRLGAVSLQRRFVAGVGIVAVALLLAGAWTSNSAIERSMLRDVDERLADAAQRSALLVDRVLAEQRQQMAMLAAMPSVVDAARSGGELARSRRLSELGVDSLERRFARTRSQQVSPRTLAYLRRLLPTLGIADVMVTDDFGYNALVTAPSADFVQSDEGWWQHAWSDTSSAATATEDAAVSRAIVELARPIVTAGAEPRRLGVVKIKFDLATIDSALVRASQGNSVRVDLVDTLGRLIASSRKGARLRVVPALAPIARSTSDTALALDDSGAVRRAMTAPANARAWRVVAHLDMASALGAYEATRTRLLIAVGLAFVVIVGGLIAVNGFVERRISRPASDLALVAEAVASGDLSAEVPMLDTQDEIGRLSRAVATMVAELRRLVRAMGSAASHTASMSVEITAGSEEMAAAAGEIATTASDLSRQASTMAQTIQWLASSSETLATLAVELDAGAQEGVDRNRELKSLALENRARLAESTTALATLGEEVKAGAAAVDELAEASIEVRTFVALVQKLARQSKLLALNAAMEAARAGEHGEGFAVVAGEVRRLAAMSSEAAERTQAVVAGVLQGIERSRESSERMVSTVRAVRAATEQGSRSFDEIERSVNGSDAWTASVGETARTARTLADELRSRTESLASGTETFAAAMQQVAASSEEQSASSEEIAAAASTLATAAEQLATLVANLRIATAAEPEFSSGVSAGSTGAGSEGERRHDAPSAPPLSGLTLAGGVSA